MTGGAPVQAIHEVHEAIRDHAPNLIPDAGVLRTFDAFRKKRNSTGYERAGAVSDSEALAMRQLALQLRRGGRMAAAEPQGRSVRSDSGSVIRDQRFVISDK